jgi:hypothetical protein
MPPAEKPDPKPAKPELPAKIKMITEYGFYEGEGEDKHFRHWKEGAAVTDPAEIALLVERKAPYWVPKA